MFASHGGGPGDAGDSMAEDDNDDGDGDGGVFSMDMSADFLEEECSEQLTPRESLVLLPEDVFAAAHTGDCQAVRAFLADPRGDVNARDRHTTVLALTLLSLARHSNPNPCHIPPRLLCSSPNPKPGQAHAGLLSAGASVHVTDAFGCTAISSASCPLDHQPIRCKLARGAAPTASRQVCALTPLVSAPVRSHSHTRLRANGGRRWCSA